MGMLLSKTVHPELRPVVSKMNFFDTVLFCIIHFVDKLGIWHKVPVFLGLGYLGIRRHLHQRYNLKAVGQLTRKKFDVDEFPNRTPDGTFNEPDDQLAGSSGTFFGRNMSPSTSNYELMDPHPSVVASKLLMRTEFADTGKQFNMLACSWIQLMIHDWVDHWEDTRHAEIEAPEEVANMCPLRSFRFFQTKKFLTGSADVKIGYVNRTPWWDASVIDGNDVTGMKRVRTFIDGKLKIAGNGLLEHDENGIAISGDVRNSWAELSALQVLFIKEHNSVCDMLKDHNTGDPFQKGYPDFDDEKLYQHARLVTSAIIAKIHTIDWTVELLKTNTLLAGMRINWYGILGKKFKDTFGPVFGSMLSGYIGQKRPKDHGVPYSLTEEFVSVYRMHSLLPDKLILRDITSNDSEKGSLDIEEEIPMENLVGKEGEKRLSKIGMEQMVVSMGHQACGALNLHNYPTWMQKLVPQDVNGKDRLDLVDLAALEIYRDRERGVARYNEFRRKMLMIPISRWEDLTDDKEVIGAFCEVYGDDVEKLDLLVGMEAEKKITGFAISETAFFIFLLMASRRLEADRFFTENFNAKSYTEEGLAWVNKTENLKDVIERHFPEMTKKWMRSSSGFTVWDSAPTQASWIPLYLRPATP